MKKLLLILIVVLSSFVSGNGQGCQYSFYQDYGFAAHDHSRSLWAFRSEPIPNDTIYTAASVVFSSSKIAGYYSKDQMVVISDGQSYVIDTLYAAIGHENNSGLTDTIIMLACNTDITGSPNENDIVWSDTLFTAQSLSPSGDYMNGVYNLKFPTQLSVSDNNDIAVIIKYYGSALDSFAIEGSCFDWSVDNLSSDSSKFAYSFFKQSYSYPNWTQNAATITDLPNSFGWLNPQNWSISAHLCLDTIPLNIVSEICMVTLDTTNHWEVIWNQGTSPEIASISIFAIERVFAGGQWALWTTIDHYYSVPANNERRFTLPFSSIYCDGVYFESKDILGNVIQGSQWHRPLQIDPQNISTHTKLTIQIYWGFDYNMYYIYRGTTSDNMVLYDSLPHVFGGDEDYYDNEANSWGHYYQVKIKPEINCLFTEASSNIVQYSVVGLTEQQTLLNSISLYPNPAQNNVTVNLSKQPNNEVSINILNPMGQLVQKEVFNKSAGQKLTVDVAALPTGIYFVQVQAFGGVKAFRLIKV